MKKLIISIAALAAFNIMAAETAAPAPVSGGKPVAKKIDRAKLQAALYKRNGGNLKLPDSQKGRVVYVNAQKKAPTNWLKQNADVFAANTKIQIDVEEGAFSFPNPKIHGEASLYVIDDPAMPPLLSAPESRWAMVNVAPLATGAGEKPQFFAARVQKELTRGFCLLAGTQTSNYPNSLLGCVTKPADLDLFEDCRLPVDILGRFVPYLEGYGVKPYILSTYRKACQEGWAPAPTNDVQQAIWDKVHQTPAEPIKIEFDPKTGR